MKEQDAVRFRAGSHWGFRIGLILFLVSGFNSPVKAARDLPVISDATVCSSNLGFGETTHCSIDLAGETDSFTFTGSTGDRIRARVVETSGALTAFEEIIRPNGTSLCASVTGEMTCLLDSSGTYTLLVNDFGGTDTGMYSLYLQRLTNPAGCSAISFNGLPTTGTIDQAAVNDCYTIPLSSGDRVRGRVVETAGSLSAFMEIVRPDGTTLCGSITGEMTCLADVDGSHTLLIKDFSGKATGNYSLYLQRLNNPVGCFSIAFSGIPRTGAIDLPAEMDCFTFSGFSDKTIRVRTVATSGTVTPFKEVVRPDGTTLCASVTNEVTCQLDTTGLHTILISDFGGTDSGVYQLTLVCLTQPCGPPFPYGVLLPVVTNSE